MFASFQQNGGFWLKTMITRSWTLLTHGRQYIWIWNTSTYLKLIWKSEKKIQFKDHSLTAKHTKYVQCWLHTKATPHSSPHMQWHRSVQLDHNDNKKGIRRKWDKIHLTISAHGMSACLYNKAVHSTEASQKQQL